MKTLIKNALVLPMKNDFEYFKADILIEDSAISKIGKIDEKADDVIDASSYIALPSFVNTHTHLAMVLMRNYKDDKENLQAWLSEIFPIEDKLNESDIYASSRAGIAELIKGGCTTFLDMYFFAHESEKAVKEAGINANLGLTFFGSLEATEERYSSRFPLMKKEGDGYSKISFSAAPHAIYTTTGESYKRALEIAKNEAMIVHTHISETKKEVEDSIKEFGAPPLEYLSSINALYEDNTVLAHGVHLTDKELDIVKEMNLSVVNNPSSNMKLTSGALDTLKLLKKGINVSLGTDGASSNNNLNMMKEINIAALSASLKAEKPVNAYEILKMATINGAKALHLENRIGSIEEGKDADLILIDTSKINLNPLNNPFSALVYSASSEDIKTVFSSGVKLMDNRKLLYADEEEIVYNLNKTWQDILRR